MKNNIEKRVIIDNKGDPRYTESGDPPPSSTHQSGRKIKYRKSYECPYNGCYKVFSESGNLKTHLRIHQFQTGERPFICEYPNCSKSFITRGHLKSHLLIHTGEKPFTCSVCGKEYSRSGRLKIHMRTHTGERPFVCPYDNCTKAFSEKGNLKTHMRIHTGEKPFMCSFAGCNKTFTTQGHLTDHIRRHTGDRPFCCKVCNQTFMRSSTLKIHYRQHTGEKPYICTYPGCNKRFSESGNLKTHFKVHNKNTVEIKEEIPESEIDSEGERVNSEEINLGKECDIEKGEGEEEKVPPLPLLPIQNGIEMERASGVGRFPNLGGSPAEYTSSNYAETMMQMGGYPTPCATTANISPIVFGPTPHPHITGNESPTFSKLCNDPSGEKPSLPGFSPAFQPMHQSSIFPSPMHGRMLPIPDPSPLNKISFSPDNTPPNYEQRRGMYGGFIPPQNYSQAPHHSAFKISSPSVIERTQGGGFHRSLQHLSPYQTSKFAEGKVHPEGIVHPVHPILPVHPVVYQNSEGEYGEYKIREGTRVRVEGLGEEEHIFPHLPPLNLQVKEEDKGSDHNNESNKGNKGNKQKSEVEEELEERPPPLPLSSILREGERSPTSHNVLKSYGKYEYGTNTLHNGQLLSLSPSPVFMGGQQSTSPIQGYLNCNTKGTPLFWSLTPTSGVNRGRGGINGGFSSPGYTHTHSHTRNVTFQSLVDHLDTHPFPTGSSGLFTPPTFSVFPPSPPPPYSYSSELPKSHFSTRYPQQPFFPTTPNTFPPFTPSNNNNNNNNNNNIDSTNQ